MIISYISFYDLVVNEKGGWEYIAMGLENVKLNRISNDLNTQHLQYGPRRLSIDNNMLCRNHFYDFEVILRLVCAA